MKTKITTQAFKREHGYGPHGEGHWAFRASRSETAFERDHVGDIFWSFGTFTEAKAEALRHFAYTTDFVTVLP